MPQESSGFLMYRAGGSQVLLVHPGGPFWKNKQRGAWSIPKGELHSGESALEAAVREFQEEVGIKPEPPFIPLGSIQQRSGKIVHAWAFCGDGEPVISSSNTFSMEWPPKSGNFEDFPEVDEAEFFEIDEARDFINQGQIPFLERLEEALLKC